MNQINNIAITLHVESIAVLLVAILLAILNRNLGYSYQRYWSLSWFTYAIHLALNGFLLSLYSTPEVLDYWYYDALIPVSIIFSYLQAYLLMAGTLVMCGLFHPTRRFHLLALIFMAMLVTAVCSIPKEVSLKEERYFFIVGVQAFIKGGIFIYCAYLIYHYEKTKLGASCFAFALAAYGLTNHALFVSSIIYFWGIRPSLWLFEVRIADAFIQTLMMFSLVAWVTENEREKVLKSEAKLKTMAMQDPVTGIPNRLWLERNFAAGIAESIKETEHHSYTALIFIDLDNFKAINDSCGHSVGDMALQEVAQKLRSFARKTDMICRLGGDEFIWVLTAPNKEIILNRAEQFKTAVTHIKTIQEMPVDVSCSLGISWCSGEDEDLKKLIGESDAALYEAKRQGKNRIIA